MVFEKLSRSIIRFSFRVFEPMSPIFLTYFLDGKLRRWEDDNLIQGFKVKAERLERYKYKVDLEFFLTKEQTRERFSDIMVKFSKLRR